MVKTKKETTLVLTWEEWYEAVGEPDRDRPIALDLETTGLSPWHSSIAVLGLYDEVTDTCAALHYPRSDHERMAGLKKQLPVEVVQWLSSEYRFFVAHNAIGFDMYFLYEAGVDIFKPRWYDTLIGEGVVVKAARRDVSVSLRTSYKRQLGKDLKKDIDHETWQAPVLSREQLEYVMHDIIYLQDLRRAQLAKVAGDSRKKAMELEQELMMVVARMVINGLPVNKAEFKAYIGWLRDNRANFEQLARDIAGRPTLNLNSPKQTLEAFEALGVPLEGTSAQILQPLRDGEESDAQRLAEAIMLYRLTKQRSNIYDDTFFAESVIPVEGGHIVRARYWQVGTDTGRFSSSTPNLQQVAGDCRTFFGQLDGNWCGTLDYNSLEVRIAAWLAKDEELLYALEAEDVHSAVAAAIFQKDSSEVLPNERKLAKAGTFTFLFGGGYTLFYDTARSQGSHMTVEEAREFEEAFFARFAGLAKTRASAVSAARHRSSVSVTMPHGLIRTLAGDTLRPSTILNTCVQGGAASGLKRALLYCKEYGVDLTLAGTVHDELIQIAPKEALGDGSEAVDLDAPAEGQIVALTRHAMEQGMLWAFPGEINGQPFPVRVGITVDDHWAGPPPYDLESLRAKAGRHA